MPVDWLVENFNICIDAINKHKPGGSPGKINYINFTENL